MQDVRMDVSPYTNYVKSMVEHGERRLTEINWLFESVERSLSSAEKNFLAKKNPAKMFAAETFFG